MAEAAAEIARAAARSWLAPLLDLACDRLSCVLGNLFDIAVERDRHHPSVGKTPCLFFVKVSFNKKSIKIAIFKCYFSFHSVN